MSSYAFNPSNPTLLDKSVMFDLSVLTTQEKNYPTEVCLYLNVTEDCFTSPSADDTFDVRLHGERQF